MPGSEVREGVRYLCERQHADGMWRDYALEPGPSDAWVTAVAGCALARVATRASPASIDRARRALLAAVRPEGWGYNGTTACDADSTAWAVRLLGRGGAALSRYLDEGGRAHTFADAVRFGTWAGAHADVTAVAGLALAETGAPRWIVRQMRRATLDDQQPGGSWRAFWWAHDAYATARNLELLAATGGVPPRVGARTRAWLQAAPAPRDAVAAASLLAVAVHAGAPHLPARRALLALRRPDGSWPPSPALVDHDQRTGARREPVADAGGTVSTALALMSLAAAGGPAGSQGAARPSRGALLAAS